MKVTLEGDDAVRAALRRMDADLGEGLAPAGAADALEVSARAACPRRTGRLAASLLGRVEHGRVALTSAEPYARPVAARSGFLGAALGAAMPAVARSFTDDLQRLCDRVHHAG